LRSNPESPILQEIEQSWQGSEAWPDLKRAMRTAFSPKQEPKSSPDQGLSRWALLPGLCCQAAGGSARSADKFTAAWLLYYLAADIMDSVEDQDEPADWWAELGPGAAINVASGLFFTAAQLLNQLHVKETPPTNLNLLINDFYNTFLVMCSGQHLEFSPLALNLDRYWKIAEAKSGEFFALACRGGAQLATDDQTIWRHYYRFGRSIGLLVQICDDLDDLKTLELENLPIRKEDLLKSLPVVYALEVWHPTKQQNFLYNLAESIHDADAAKEAYQMLDDSGAVLYLLTKIESHIEIAKSSLKQASPEPEAHKKLLGYLERFDLY
jgi:geranylgeranyl pyrophosphate synthase